MFLLLATAIGLTANAVAAGKAFSLLPAIHFDGPFTAEAGGVQNIHVTFSRPVDGELAIYYGACDIISPHEAYHRVGKTHVGQHPLARRHAGWESNRPTRFTWLPPTATFSGGCLHAFNGEELVGKSLPFDIKRRMAKRGVPFADVVDAEGPWFDGVEYLSEKEPDSVFVSQAKEKTIGIIGGGMAGLLTSVSQTLD